MSTSVPPLPTEVKVPVDLNRLGAEISEPPSQYKPPMHRERPTMTETMQKPLTPPPAFSDRMAQTPLQMIASSIKRLTWDDNEKFADTIATHLDKVEQGRIAKALQQACDELLKDA